jgi:hypothetical protein
MSRPPMPIVEDALQQELRSYHKRIVKDEFHQGFRFRLHLVVRACILLKKKKRNFVIRNSFQIFQFLCQISNGKIEIKKRLTASPRPLVLRGCEQLKYGILRAASKRPQDIWQKVSILGYNYHYLFKTTTDDILIVFAISAA